MSSQCTDYVRAFVCVDHNCGKFLRRWEYQTTLPAPWETWMQVKKKQLEPKQLTGSKLGMEYVKAVYCHPALFNLYTEYIMQNAGLDESQAGIKIAGKKISITSDMQMIPL